MRRGTPRPGNGGKRKGAGKKLPPKVVEFREYWRKRLLGPEWHARIGKWCAEDPDFFLHFLSFIEPKPTQSVALTGDPSAPVHHEHRFTYVTRGPESENPGA